MPKKTPHPHQSPIALDVFWPYQAVYLADQISRYTLSRAKSEAGLNLSQWRVLAAIAEKPGRTSREVTDITPMDKTIVSRAVSTLLANDLIEKKPDVTDKRRMALHATPQGYDIFTTIAARLNADLIDNLPDLENAKDFVKTLKRFSLHMDKIDP